MSESNKAIKRRCAAEVFTEGKLALVDEMFASNFVYHEPTGHEVHGPEAVKQQAIMYRTAFPDLKVTINDMIAEGDKVVTHYTVQGTHHGELMGIPPTGKQVTLAGIVIDRFSGGQIVEEWEIADALGLMQQLGVIPAPAQG